MMHDYDNPNTCYAIGDAFVQNMGTATTTRTPSSGVVEQISFVSKNGVTDGFSLPAGVTQFIDTAVNTTVIHGNAAALRQSPWNMAVLINEDNAIRKNGSTDQHVIGGVQVDA